MASAVANLVVGLAFFKSSRDVKNATGNRYINDLREILTASGTVRDLESLYVNVNDAALLMYTCQLALAEIMEIAALPSSKDTILLRNIVRELAQAITLLAGDKVKYNVDAVGVTDFYMGK